MVPSFILCYKALGGSEESAGSMATEAEWGDEGIGGGQGHLHLKASHMGIDKIYLNIHIDQYGTIGY